MQEMSQTGDNSIFVGSLDCCLYMQVVCGFIEDEIGVNCVNSSVLLFVVFEFQL